MQISANDQNTELQTGHTLETSHEEAAETKTYLLLNGSTEPQISCCLFHARTHLERETKRANQDSGINVARVK